MVALAVVFLGAVDLTVVATILPSLITDLGLNSADVDRHIWVVNAYLIAYLVSIPIVGKVSDRVGRIVTLQASLAVFAAGSIVCATADSFAVLVAARVIQGAGGGALLPTTMALVGDVVPRARRQAALGLVAAADTIGWAIGPIWGAVAVTLPFGGDQAWRLAFWANVPLAAAGMVGLARGGRAVRRVTDDRARLDLVGLTLLAVALTLGTMTLSSGGELGGTPTSGTRAFGGSSNPLAGHLLPLGLGAVAVIGALVWWERRTAAPIMPAALIAAPAFRGSLAANFLVGLTLIVAMVNVPVVVALTVASDRVSSLSASLLVPYTGAMTLMAWLGGKLAARWGDRPVGMAGLSLAAFGYGVAWSLLDADRLVLVAPALLLAGAGFGMVIAPIGSSALSVIPGSVRGLGAGLLMVARLLGMTIGISVLTSFGVQRLQMLTGDLEPIDPAPGETTGQFLVRQQRYIEDVAIPLGVRVVEETFLIAAILTLAAVIPVAMMGREPAGVEAAAVSLE
ncbi:MAG: MFS transporter [Chloroflexota bacterium]|nr:MFS transporter [Chloroflexia bacterium]MDQ3167104.1 MFS transporter [Chloroflexota bacterium]